MKIDINLLPKKIPLHITNQFPVTCGRCGYRQHRCQCGSSQRPREFVVAMRLARDKHGLPVESSTRVTRVTDHGIETSVEAKA